MATKWYEFGWEETKPIWQVVEEKFDEYMFYKHGYHLGGISRLRSDGYFMWSDNYRDMTYADIYKEEAHSG